ncbi:hypothetical protein ACHAXA_004247 [Cyclostephanos tholiformis]|uniref:Uncharacterized protein n=1 Tax=Cyclostephanos tholiformis TaxID=382380 RepID=A0ABD3RGZ8_9STRA
MIQRNGCVAQDAVKRPAIRMHAKHSTTMAVFLMARTASAFLGQGPPALLAIVPGAFSRHPYTTRAEVMMLSSRAEDASPRDDPWIILDEIKTWVVCNKGKYDLSELQNAISDLRDESQFNIQTLEREIIIIQHALQNSEYYPSQSTSGDIFSDCAATPMPTLKAVFAGYKVTKYDRMRLASAHPEDHSR